MSELDLNEIAKGIKDERVSEVYSLLAKYKDAAARTEWKQRRDEAWAAMENDFTDSKAKAQKDKKNQPDVPINKINKGVQGSSALVTDQKPGILFNPIGDTDLYVAELLKRGHDFIWEKNEAQDMTYEGVEEVKVGGLAWFDVHFDRGKGTFGSVVLDLEDPEDVYVDPKAKRRDFSDSHIIKAKKRSKRYLKAAYGKQITDEDLIYDAGLDKDDEGEKSSGITTGDNYAVFDSPKDGRGVPDSPAKQIENLWEIEAWILDTIREPALWYVDRWVTEKQVQAIAQEQGTTPEQMLEGLGLEIMERVREVRKLRIIVGKKLIKQTDQDGNEVDELINPHGEDCDGRPILGLIPLKGQKTRNAYPMSPTSFALPINRDKNKRRAQFTLHLAHNVNSPIIEPANSVEWVGSPGEPGSRAKVSQTAAFKPERLSPGTFQVHHFIELEQMDDRDIEDQFDTSDLLQGKIPKGIGQIAEKTVIALQDFGAMMSKPFLRALESTLVRVAKATMAIAFRHWPREMWERLIEATELQTWIPDNTDEAYRQQELGMKPDLMQQAYAGDATGLPEEVRLQIEKKWLEALERVCPEDQDKEPDISILTVDIKMMAGSTMPTNRMAKEVIALDRVNRGIYDAEAALEYVDDPNRDKIIARLKAKEQMLVEQNLQKTAGG